MCCVSRIGDQVGPNQVRGVAEMAAALLVHLNSLPTEMGEPVAVGQHGRFGWEGTDPEVRGRRSGTSNRTTA